MQHHSAPTRLIDWTYSLYAAAYFTVSAHWDRDGAVYCVHSDKLKSAMHHGYGSSRPSWMNNSKGKIPRSSFNLGLQCVNWIAS
jgi:FRG domain